jgi:uncharacterized protein YbbC (DUF1343 family)
MIEGTEVSEGRGTTRPFEIIGAPYIEPYRLVESIRARGLPGVAFRALHFEPTFHKFKGEFCGGIQLHITDRATFKPVITAVAVLSAIRELWPNEFAWKQPPYEYVYDRLPFDVINGGPQLRQQIESGVTPAEIEASWNAGIQRFKELRSAYLLYE